jgi:hypothetical protein
LLLLAARDADAVAFERLGTREVDVDLDIS